MKNIIKINCTGTRLVDFKDLIEFQEDIKHITRENLDKLKASIKASFKLPFAVWENDNQLFILDGHQRLKAIEELDKEGWEIPALPAVEIFEETKEAAKATVLDLTSQHGKFSKLNVELYMKKYNLSPQNIVLRNAPITLTSVVRTRVDEDDPDPWPEQITEKGDVWELGPHRLMCGDSRNSDEIEKLTGGVHIELVNTDPPYGIEVVQDSKIGADNITRVHRFKNIKGDETTETARLFYESCLSLGYKNFIIWGGNHFTEFLPPSPRWIVWDKKARANFTQAEMAWTSFDKGGVSVLTFTWHGMTREGSRVDELKERIYPTQKPVGLFAEIIAGYPECKTILDGFIGSGTTLIAAEKTGRICYAMDYEEYSCDIVAKRYYEWRKANGLGIDIKLNGEAVDVSILEKITNEGEG